jgi:hypothetical protein
MFQTLPATSLLAILILVASAQADEANLPKPGQKATLSCEGLYGGTYVYEVDEIDGDDIVYKFTAPKNTHRTLVMPRWALGTSLYRKDYGEGYGRGEMTAGLDAFKPLQLLTPGASAEGELTERSTGSPSKTWHYQVTVGERRQIHHDVLGEIEIIVVKEHRSTSGYSSDRETEISPALSEVVSSHYSDSKGKKRDCQLVTFKPGS